MGMRSNIQASQEECHEQGKYEGSKQTMKGGKSNRLKRMAIAAVCVGMIGSGGLVQAMTMNTAKPVAINTNKNGGAVKVGATTLIRVPASRITSVPTGEKDTITRVNLPDFEIGKTEVTNDLFSMVASWAHRNGKGYQIAEGYKHFNEAGKDKYPVTSVSWCQVIVWLNAYSEMHGLEPVYWKKGWLLSKPSIYKDALDTKTCDDIEVRSRNSGYQLPSDMQFNIAARWLGTTSPTKGSLVKKRLATKGKDRRTYYWTPGNYASGATEDVNNKKETARVAVERAVTRPVGSKAPNKLGLFDMSGNVGEWLSTPGYERQRMRISSGIPDKRQDLNNPQYQQYNWISLYGPNFYTGHIDPFALSHRIIQDPGQGSQVGSQGQCSRSKQNCAMEHKSYYDIGFRVARNAK